MNVVTITTKPAPAFTSEKELTLQGFVLVGNYRECDIADDRGGSQTGRPAKLAFSERSRAFLA